MDDKALMPPPKILPFCQMKSAHENFKKLQIQNNGTRNPLLQFAHPFRLHYSRRARKNFQKNKFPFKNVAKKKKKKKKVPKISPKPRPKAEWNLEDAKRALLFESEYNAYKGENQIKLVFPDEPHDLESVRRFHPNLKYVSPLQATMQRFCYISLRPGADVDKVIAELNNKPLPEFNGKCATATLYNTPSSAEKVTPEVIDPYTLYIGNVPLNISPTYFAKTFPNKRRVTVGVSHKLRSTRYAFIRFRTLNESIEAFKKALTFSFNSHNLFIRFKRLRDLPHGGVRESSCSPADGDEEMFRFRPEFLPKPHECDLDSNVDIEEYDGASDIFDPDEYDLDEIYPMPKAPKLALLKFLTSDDENQSVTDFDVEKNLPILPDDLVSNKLTESLLDLDSPF